jgi:hypothetical protein
MFLLPYRGFDGHSLELRHAGVKRTWGYHWAAGDVIGAMVDVDAGTIEFSLNGAFEAPMGHAWGGAGASAVKFSRSLIPAVSFDAAFQFEVNFGERPFRYAMPANCHSVRRWWRSKMESVHARNAGARFGKLVATTGDALMEISPDNVIVAKNSQNMFDHSFPSAVLQGVLLTRGKWVS